MACEQTEHLQRTDVSQASPHALSLAPICPLLCRPVLIRESSREGKTAEFTASGKKIPVSEPDHFRPGFASEGKPLKSPTAALPHGICSFYSIKFPVTKVNGPHGICLKVSEAPGWPAISRETGGDWKHQKEQRSSQVAGNWQTLADTPLAKSSRLKITLKGKDLYTEFLQNLHSSRRSNNYPEDSMPLSIFTTLAQEKPAHRSTVPD